jgi:hypothetical protein
MARESLLRVLQGGYEKEGMGGIVPGTVVSPVTAGKSLPRPCVLTSIPESGGRFPSRNDRETVGDMDVPGRRMMRMASFGYILAGSDPAGSRVVQYIWW